MDCFKNHGFENDGFENQWILKEGFEVEIFLFLATDFADYAEKYSRENAQKAQTFFRPRRTRRKTKKQVHCS